MKERDLVLFVAALAFATLLVMGSSAAGEAGSVEGRIQASEGLGLSGAITVDGSAELAHLPTAGETTHTSSSRPRPWRSATPGREATRSTTNRRAGTGSRRTRAHH